MSIIKKIKQYYRKNKTILFTTPSHSQGEFIIPKLNKLLGKDYFKIDFSEIDGFDNLRNPKGILKKLQRDFAKIYDTKATFMLTNGSTSGIIAAINSVVKEGEKILLARNCHISVYNALVITGAIPIWFLPEYNHEWDIYNGVKGTDIQRLVAKHSDIKAIVITSPTYEGVFSEIELISQICKQNNIKLIVDEAHGALLKFDQTLQKSAINLGADISVQSLHKTAGAPNPCALLHLGKDSGISISNIQDNLNLINTTSPSYPIMCAIEATVKYLDSKKGRKNLINLHKEITNFKKKLHPNICVLEKNDKTKILIKIDGVPTENITKILNRCFDIEEEYSNNKSLLFITGIGTTKNKLKKLRKALNDIYLKTDKIKTTEIANKVYLPQTVMTPRKALQSDKRKIETTESLGEICGEIIIKYPPGIPSILPGEIITVENIFSIENDQISIIE